MTSYYSQAQLYMLYYEEAVIMEQWTSQHGLEIMPHLGLTIGYVGTQYVQV